LLLVGDGRVGLKELANFVGTVQDSTFNTSSGPIKFNVLNAEGANKSGERFTDVYRGGQAAIIMYDLSSAITYKNLPCWHRDLKGACGNIPIVLVGNQFGMQPRSFSADRATYHIKMNLKYYETSTLTGENVVAPLRWLARKLMEDDSLQFLDFHDMNAPAAANLITPGVVMDEATN
jgi:GTP-binding nuclear protein Ran